MADLIALGLEAITGKMSQYQAADTLVDINGDPLEQSAVYFFARTATNASPMQWNSSVINNSGFTQTVSNSLIEVPSAGKYLIIAKAQVPFGGGASLTIRVNSVNVCQTTGNAGAGGFASNVCMHVVDITTPASQKIDVTNGSVNANVLSNSLTILKLS